MGETLYAAFPDPDEAERAAGALLDHGVLPAEISLVLSEEYLRRRGTPNDPELSYTLPTITSGFTGRASRVDPLGNEVRNSGEISIMAGEVGPMSQVRMPDEPAEVDQTVERRHVEQGIPEYDPEQAAKHGLTTTTPEDAEAGAAKGAGIGLGVGVLATLASLAIPGFGLVVGGGALATAIAGLVGTTGAGAVAGGLVGFLKDQGVPHHVAPTYHAAHAGGGAVLSVHLPTRLPRAELDELLRKYGAESLVSHAAYVA